MEFLLSTRSLPAIRPIVNFAEESIFHFAAEPGPPAGALLINFPPPRRPTVPSAVGGRGARGSARRSGGRGDAVGPRLLGCK